ncbi:hypothetical protein CC1G_11221 [Coprinopsis cinerea okayama7|uniref:Uncharacterized protein n=1 Tax=Coprinopsis cinerea (strain Okayama-7 / 130 / ATCC MYA-4618 / FGSC 9003) TaxID=240176 RepID=A8N120_COPC7|nr:hypothetical protein CC1G_11221 [Coprinopsis cinerea okayama7\|eukprot:XP_001828569.2 hypothetical protein CC1G_11221 [Coprinopsis cinerea okayama7\
MSTYATTTYSSPRSRQSTSSYSNVHSTSSRPRRFSFVRYHAANARTHALITHLRQTFPPRTYRAKRRAMGLNLRVDTIKAVNLDHRQVSVVPLPVIVTDPSPVPLPSGKRQVGALQGMPVDVEEEEEEGQGVLDFRNVVASTSKDNIANPIQATQGAQIQRPSNRPSLRCVIPITIVDTRGYQLDSTVSSTSSNGGLRSRFSSDTEYSDISLNSSLRHTDVESAGPAPGSGSPSSFFSPSSFVDEFYRLRSCSPVSSPSPSFEPSALSIYCSADGVDRCSIPSTSGPTQGHSRSVSVPSALHVRPRPVQALHVPQDVGRPMSWGCGEVKAYEDGGAVSPLSDASNGGTSDAGSSSTNSSGPVTPDDCDSGSSSRASSAALRSIKRKSTNLEDVTEFGVFEKRPKFERKTWLFSHSDVNPGHRAQQAQDGSRFRAFRGLPSRRL